MMKLIYFLVNHPCEDPEVLKIIYYIRTILGAAFTIIPIVLIVMITFDFVKSVSAGTEDTMKKNQKLVIKRIIYCLMVFMVMPIVNITFNAFKTSGNEGLISDTKGANYLSCWANADEIASIVALKIDAKFVTNGGRLYGGSSTSCGGTDSCDIILPVASKTGFIFKGWIKSGSSEEYQAGQKVTINRGDQFEAKWEEKPEEEEVITDEEAIGKEEENKENTTDSENTTDGGSGSSSVTLDASGFYVYEFNGIKYYTIANAVDFHQYVKDNEFYQEADENNWGDSCLGFSFVYADAIKNKNFEIINNQPGLDGNGNDASTNSGFSEEETSNKGTILSTIYEEIQKHNPVVIHVNGNSEGTSRHYSVIIGVKDTVDTSNIQETDFLLLDVWDGNIEHMNGKGGENGVDEWKSRFMIQGTDTGNGRSYGYQVYLID